MHRGAEEKPANQLKSFCLLVLVRVASAQSYPYGLIPLRGTLRGNSPLAPCGGVGTSLNHGGLGPSFLLGCAVIDARPRLSS